MRKLYILSLLALAVLPVSASHLMGGQITAARTGNGYDYQITMTLYRDTVGIPMYTIETLHISSDTVAGSSPVDSSINVPAAVSFGNGVEEYTYQLNYTFPGPGDYVVYWSNCCRNMAILNLPNPGGNSMFLSTKIHVGTTNSTPVFLNPPIPIAQLGVPFTYNSLPFDADGDSIAWRLDIPLDQTAGTLYDTIPGYVLPFSDTTMPFALNAVTSEISFLPVTQGHFVVSLAVDEFRNGVKIGEIRRDMQIIVVGSGNSPRLASFTSNINPTSARTIHIDQGATLHLIVSVTDPVDNDPLQISAAGSAFLLTNPPAFTTTAGTGSIQADLTWTPSSNEGSLHPYITSFRIGETHGGFTFFRDETFLLYVARSVGIEEIYGNISSNWTYGHDLLSGKIHVDKPASLSISLVTLDGRNVAELYNDKINTGTHQFVFEAGQLPTGIYLLQSKFDGQHSLTSKIMIAR